MSVKSLLRGTCLCLCLLVLSFPVRAQDGSGGIEVLEVDEQPVERGPGGQSINRILAVVEDQAITLQEYVSEFGDTNVKRSKLDQLINKQLIRQAGREAGVILDRARIKQFVDTRIRQIKKQGRRKFRRYLSREGLTEEGYRTNLMNEIRDQRLRSRVLIQFFPQLARPDTRAAQQLIRGRLMALSDSETAWEVFRSLRENPRMSTWNKLFEEHSRKLSFTDEHGRLGWFEWGTYNEEIEYQLFKNDLYRLSRPFTIRGQYALVIPTGFRLETLSGTMSTKKSRLYESYRRRRYSERLSEVLRGRYSVNIPESVRSEINSNA